MHYCSYFYIVNRLSLYKRTKILHMLVEGSSMRAISRVIGCSINTVTKMLIEAGEACLEYHDENVRDLNSKRVQCDEIWSFNYAKQKNVDAAKKAPTFTGDIWTWTSIDTDSKLICNWFVGGRDAEYANVFLNDLAARLSNKVQLTIDGHKAYLNAVDSAFGNDIDYAMLVRLYGLSPDAGKGCYSPAQCNGAKKKAAKGEPEEEHISTSYADRQNLTMRSSMRRFTRLTNGFYKKYENHCHALALYFVYYNFCRQHKSLGGVSPAMEVRLTKTLHDLEWIVGLMDARAPKPGRPKSYKKRKTSN